MVKMHSIIEFIILFSVAFMLGYFNMIIPGVIESHLSVFRLLLAIVGIMMFFYVLIKKHKDAILKKYCIFLDKYLIVYIPILIVVSFYSYIKYEYSMLPFLYAITPYLYIFYAYPVIYVFRKEKTFTKLLKKIAILVAGMLIIKACIWALYNFAGIVVFPTILFQYTESWIRNGNLRVDPGYFVGFFYAWMFYLFYTKKKKIKAIIGIVGIMLFITFITQFRYQQITLISVLALEYFFASGNKKKKSIRILFAAMFIGVFIVLGGLDAIIQMFSPSGTYGKSTITRLENVLHFWNLYIGTNMVTGLGILSTSNVITSAMMERAINVSSGIFATRYYLSDIGILGGFFTFGLLAIPLYGIIFYQSINVCIKILKKSSNLNKIAPLLIGVVSYTVISCIALNVFDNQRSFNLIIDLALISYINGMTLPRTKIN